MPLTPPPKLALLVTVCVFCSVATAADNSPGVSSASPASAAASAPDAHTKLERVEITGESDPRKSSVTMKSLVTSEDIGRYGDASITDILRRVPGITVSGIPGRGGEIRMQGLGTGYTQILINGEPTSPGFSLDSLSPAVIERIEVLRSPTADMSSQAIAGTINIILKQTVRPAQRGLKASVGGYAGNPSYQLEGQLSDRAKDLSYSISGGLSRETNEWPSSIEQTATDGSGALTGRRLTTKVETARSDTLNVAPRLGWKLGEGEELSVEMLARWRHIQAETIDQRTTTLGLPPLYASNDLQLALDTANVSSKLSWTRQFNDGRRLDAKAGIQYGRRRSTAKFLGFDELGATVLDENTSSETADTALTLGGKYRTASIEDHAFGVGWDGEVGRRSEDRTQRQTAPVGYPAVDMDESFDAQVSRLALFAQDEWDLSKQVSVYLGLRWEGLETRSLGNVLDEVRNRSSVFSPLAQVVWKLQAAGNDRLRMSIGRTYKAPNTRDLMPRRYVANDNTPTTPDLQGNPNLRPELAWGLDLTLDHYIGKAGSVTIGANARRIEDVILQELTQDSRGWVSSPVNSASANTYGFQLESRLSLSKLDASLPEVDARASAAWNWSSVASVPGPNNRLDRQDPFVATFAIDYRPRNTSLTLGSSFNHQRSGFARTSVSQTASNGEKQILDVYGLWKYSPGTQIRLSASNVLGRDYVTAASYFDSLERIDQLTTTPTRRVLKLTFEMKL